MNRNDDLSENLNYTAPELPILTSDEETGIEIPVTMINPGAFSGMEQLKKVTIPDTVIKIDTGAFVRENLERVPGNGDLDADGSVSVTDVIVLQKHLHGLRTLTASEAAAA